MEKGLGVSYVYFQVFVVTQFSKYELIGTM